MTKLRLLPALIAAATTTAALAVETAVPNKTTQLPEILVSASEPTTTGSILKEKGVYNQPGWTKQRRFSTTRVFVQRDPWEIGLAQWWRLRASDGKQPQHRFVEEFEIGLPYRAQLDIYYDWTHKNGNTDFEDVGVELRWALADWDVIPLNPTLYAEYKWANHDLGGDVLELKLLLGDNIGDDLSYGINFIWEQELTHSKTTEWQVSGGLSYDISDAISAGVESRYIRETVAGERGNPEHKFLIGPSLQFRPSRNTFIDLVSLFGVTKAAADIEAYLIFGINFGPGGKKVHQPVSGAHN